MSKNGRKTLRHCKDCGQPFNETNRTKECPNCNSKRMKIMTKLAAQKNKEEQNEWKQKIITTKTNTPTKEEWTDETRDISTKSKCTTCGEVHFKTDKYDHEYTQIRETECITLNNVLRLMIEFEQEKDTKSTECLRFLNRKGLLRE